MLNDVDVLERAEAALENSINLEFTQDTAAMTETISIKAVEFGKLPGTLSLEKGKTLGQLIADGVPHDGQDFYVNGNLSNKDTILNEGDAVVGAPKVIGG